MKKGKTFSPVLREEESEEVIDVQVADMAWQLHSVDVSISLQRWVSQDSDEQHCRDPRTMNFMDIYERCFYGHYKLFFV